MGQCISTTSRHQSTVRVGQGTICGGCQLLRPRTASIHILDDDSLLHVFFLYRPFLLGEDEDDNARLCGGRGAWVRDRWWYKLAHVCQRWRNVIFGSASHLGLSLVCTYGTPVADMLAHSPHLPLVIDYYNKSRDVAEEDEVGIFHALRQRERVRRIRLGMPITSLRKFTVAIDEEYPILEYLVIAPPAEDNSSILTFPGTLQAPHLRHLRLQGFALPIGSRLLTTAVGLVTLSLLMVHPSTYFHPNTLLQWISLMSQLETLAIYFEFPILNRDVERPLTPTPVIDTPVPLPNLHLFQFRGVSSYLEALVHRITTTRLEKLHIEFFNQLTFSVPRLLQFIGAAENLRFGLAAFTFFDNEVDVVVYPHGEIRVHALRIVVKCLHLDWRVSSMAQISDSLSQIFSAVEYVTLQHTAHGEPSEQHDEVDPIEWRKLLRPFTNVKTLLIDSGLINDLSCCLELEDGELPLELLPELQRLVYNGSGDTSNAFTSFINARQNVGCPVTLVHHS